MGKILKLNEKDLLPRFSEIKLHPSEFHFWMFKPEVRDKIRQFGWADFEKRSSHKIVSAPRS